MTAKQADILQVLSPLSGWSATLEDNPDEVFRGRLLGDGASIDPVRGEVYAPVDGVVLTLPDSCHAVNLRSDFGAELLVHVGVDTVALAGEGFTAHVAAGERVQAGQLLLSFDLDSVLRGARSLRTPVLLLQSDEFRLDGEIAKGLLEHGAPLFRVVREEVQEKPAETSDPGSRHSREVLVGLEHGIHARPAALLVEALKALDASVSVVTGTGTPVDARSPVALMSLGIDRGDRVEVIAHGPAAEAAVEAVCERLQPLDSALAAKVDKPAPVQAPPPADGAVIRAKSASPGLGIGPSLVLADFEPVYDRAPGDEDEERALLDGALSRVREHLDGLAAQDPGTGAEIAAAHLALLDDPLLTRGSEQSLQQGLSAPAAWRQSVDQAISTLRQANDRRMLERIDDLEDINLRVQRVLAGHGPGAAVELTHECILLAENLLPSQLLELDQGRIRGICLAAGGATSHVALLAGSLNIPMLVAAGSGILSIEDGSALQMDAELGELYVRPDEDAAVAFAARVENDRALQQAELAEAERECRTKDGVLIHVHANIASAEDAREAVRSGAEGCGLFRTEFVFMDRGQAPSLDEQRQIYQDVSDAMAGKPLVVRTLDVGGDKPIAYLDQPDEENPALGIRGIRLCQRNPELLRSQLSALLQVERPTALQIMVPMISSVHEVRDVRGVLDQLQADSAPGCDIELGVMIETPAAALIADHLAQQVDFFSIGTNDLAQYTLCMDRGEPALAGRLDVLHPAVLQLISRTVDSAATAGIPVAVCGNAAADMLAAPVLIGLGVRELSMPRNRIPRQKARMREWSVEHCSELAQQALARASAREVRALARSFVMAHSAPEESK